MAARRAACGDGGASEAGEDGAEEDGEEADARRMGRRSPGGGGGRSGRRSPGATHVPGADGGGPPAWRGRGRRRVGGRRIPGGRQWRRIPRCRGRGVPRKAAVGEDDGDSGGGHDDDNGGGSGMKKSPSAREGGSLLLYINTPLVPGRITIRDKRGPFVMVGETTRD
jgi:hypothetical protein